MALKCTRLSGGDELAHYSVKTLPLTKKLEGGTFYTALGIPRVLPWKYHCIPIRCYCALADSICTSHTMRSHPMLIHKVHQFVCVTTLRNGGEGVVTSCHNADVQPPPQRAFRTCIFMIALHFWVKRLQPELGNCARNFALGN